MRGHAHLVTQAWERLEDVFIGLGFQIAEGPEVETDWHNFEALNMGEDHPARGEFDTLFLDYAPPGGQPGRTLLRTHTSPVQIRTMLDQQPPIYIVAPGRVFRRDTPDATHMPVFHQIEGLVIDRDISLADLAGTIEAFTKAFFGAEFTSAAAAVVLPVHRAVGGVRHPAPRRLVARARRVRHGAPERAACRRHRSRAVERLRLRLRHRPHGGDAPPGRRHPRHVRQRPPLRRAVLSRSRLMKILLSWLNEYGDFADPSDADAVARLSDTMSRLGLPIDDVRHVGNVVRRCRHRRGRASRTASRRGQGAARLRRRR